MAAPVTDTTVTYIGDSGDILAACRDLIDAAQHSILLQMYLFAANGDLSFLLPRENAFAYADTVCRWLVDKKQAHPEVLIAVVLDSNTPANPALTRRGGTLIRQTLRKAGIAVLDANLFHTRFEPRRRLLPRMNFHLDHDKVPLEDRVQHQNRWQVLHNVEDHRKNMVIDGGAAGIVTSHNFFDAAWDWHENLFWLTGGAARDLWRIAADAIALALDIPQIIDPTDRTRLLNLHTDSPQRASLPTLDPVPSFPKPRPNLPASQPEADPSCRIWENTLIQPRLAALFAEASEGDTVLVATTWLSDLPTLTALEEAAARGARVKVLIDSIHGLPLPSAASWATRNLVNHRALERAGRMARHTPSFELRIHQSVGGTMMHLKTMAILKADGASVMVGGQANYTPNSFSGAWLETNIETRATHAIEAFVAQFDSLWDSPSTIAPPRRGLFGLALSGILASFEAVGLRP